MDRVSNQPSDHIRYTKSTAFNDITATINTCAQHRLPKSMSYTTSLSSLAQRVTCNYDPCGVQSKLSKQ